MAKTPKKAKEPVRLRFKTLADGNKSIYLDIYRNGKRSYEFLKLYLVPETNPLQKQVNADTLKAANAIKAQRIIELANDEAGIKNTQRRADRFLMAKQAKDSVNVSSVFLLDVPTAKDKPIVGYGNPNGNPKLKSGNPNPFAGCKNDGFLFVIAPDWKQIEWLVIPDGLCTILGNAKALADGVYNEALQTMRAAAKTYFNYWL